MANKTIFSINTEVPGSNVREIDYDSSQTLLDADIILFTPVLDVDWYNFSDSYQGKTCLSQRGSFVAVERTRHWKGEITEAAESGKLVIVYLAEPDEGFRYTGEVETSGTGQNAKETHFVAKIDSYEALPVISFRSKKTGIGMRLTRPGSILAPYWDEFSNHSSYHVEIDGEFSDTLLESTAGSRIVGAIKRYESGGAILFLPPINFDQDEFVEKDDDGDEAWTEAGLQAGKRFLGALSALAKALSADRDLTPPPDWTSFDLYRLPKENHIKKEITQVAQKLTRLEETRSTLQEGLVIAGKPRRLLFEKGTPLEDIILESLRLMGFKATRFKDGESEFDAVFTAPEGGFIGEAEGRDNKAIGIDKFSQLVRNLHEDYSRDEVKEMARGVLFGNGYRLIAPEERAETFTEKCLQAAKKTGTALIRTLDMFEPTRYLIDHPEDQDFAKACRESIANARGRIVIFPTPPKEKISRNKKQSAKN